MQGIAASTTHGYGLVGGLTFGQMFGIAQSVSMGDIGQLQSTGGNMSGVAISNSSCQVTAIGQEGFQPLVPMTPVVDVRLGIGYQPWIVGPDDVQG
jgi:hypothetical protein